MPSVRKLKADAKAINEKRLEAIRKKAIRDHEEKKKKEAPQAPPTKSSLVETSSE